MRYSQIASGFALAMTAVICVNLWHGIAQSAEPKKNKMTRPEIVAEIVDELGDEDILPFVPGIAKFKDDSGRQYYMFKSGDGTMKALEDLDMDFLDSLSARVHQARTLLHTQRIQRQLEQVRSIQNIQNIQKMIHVQTPPKVIMPPRPAPVIPSQPARAYTPPPQPPRKTYER